jgi:hypothetical protein
MALTAQSRHRRSHVRGGATFFLLTLAIAFTGHSID